MTEDKAALIALTSKSIKGQEEFLAELQSDKAALRIRLDSVILGIHLALKRIMEDDYIDVSKPDNSSR